MKAQNALKAALIQPGAEDFDWEVLDGGDFRYDVFINCLRSLPLMSKRRFLLIKRFNEIDTRRYKDILAALDGDLTSVVTALSYEKQPDFRVKSITEFKDKHTWVDLSSPKGAEFPRVLKLIAPGLELESGLVSFLADSGVDLFQISGWLEQASNFIDQGEKVTLEGISRFLDLGGTADIWRLVNAVGNKDLAKAQLSLVDLLRNREKPGTILWRLKTLFIELNLINRLKTRGANVERSIDRKMMNPYKVKKLLEQSARYPVKDVEKVLLKLQETDVRLKTSQGETESLLIELLDDIVGIGEETSE